MSRRDDIAAGLAAVESRIQEACVTVGRPRDEISLIVVTKTHPASDVDLLYELGVSDVGENRHPEAGDKAAATSHPMRWHFVGGLQTNKAGAVAQYADVVQSVDRAKLALSLARGADTAGRHIECLIQVDFDTTNPGRSGIEPAGIGALADVIATSTALSLGGLMTVAPLGDDPAPHFDHLRRLSEELRTSHPEATTISAGMSGDFEKAITEGATHLRVGRSILGERPPLR